MSNTDLLKCFFSACEYNFKFLEKQHGFQQRSGLVQSVAGHRIITPYHQQTAGGSFWACARYESNRQSAMEIVYGDTNFSLNTYLFFMRVNRVSLSDLLQVSKVPSRNAQEQTWVNSTDTIKASLKNIAELLRMHIEFLTEPDPRLIEKSLNLREKIIEEQVRLVYKKNIVRAQLDAAKAFTNKEFGRVVEILKPYERDLPGSERKKLEIALKNIEPVS